MLRLIAVLLLAAPVAAYGQTCTADTDCPDGYSCVFTPCAMYDCAPDQECPPIDCHTEGRCSQDGGSYGGWVPESDCAADADCPAGFTCDEVSLPCATEVPATCACAAPACDPASGECTAEEKCDCSDQGAPLPETDCTPTSVKLCVYHEKECASDADCAEGFECAEQQMCSGGGSAGCACTDCACPTCPEGEECPCDCPADPPPCECEEPVYTEPTCEVTGHFCQAKSIPCAADADCPANWTCLEVGVACGCPAMEYYCDPAANEACPEVPPCDCGGVEAEKYCSPDGWAGYDYGVGTSESAPQDGAAPAAGDAAFVGHDGQLTGAKATDDTTAPTNENAATGESKGSGCSLGTVPMAGSGLVLLMALSLFGLACRRERQ
jgi:Cys-rich repeat protein